MASTSKGLLTAPAERWKHLKFFKRPFWKGERQAARKEARQQSQEAIRR